jgi:hypothetical protein
MDSIQTRLLQIPTGRTALSLASALGAKTGMGANMQPDALASAAGLFTFSRAPTGLGRHPFVNSTLDS